MTQQKLTLQYFLECLREIVTDEAWSVSLDQGRITLRLAEVDAVFNPMTAVHYRLNGRVAHCESFRFDIMQHEYGMDYYDCNALCYATLGCPGQDPLLRRQLLQALGLDNG